MIGTPKIFLHTGMHKTGTTHLQWSMAANRRELMERGIYYPGTYRQGQIVSDMEGYTPYTLSVESLRFETTKMYCSAVFADIIRARNDGILKKVPQTIVLSSEGLSTEGLNVFTIATPILVSETWKGNSPDQDNKVHCGTYFFP